MITPLEKQRDEAVIRRGGRKQAEDAHGGAWKVAFADFCLALMALFLVLWLMAAREQQSLKSVIRTLGGSFTEAAGGRPAVASERHGSLIDRFPEQAPLPSNPVRQTAGPAELAELARTFAALASRAGLGANMTAVVTPHGLRVTLHDTDRQGMFTLGSATPTPRFAALLRQMGAVFGGLENQMLMIGHTDSLKYADDPDGQANWSLSTDRAMAARTRLLSGGMPATTVLQVIGMADRAPLDPRAPAAPANRRIELLVLTREQAQTVSAMFGAAGAANAIAPGVNWSGEATPANLGLRSMPTGRP